MAVTGLKTWIDAEGLDASVLELEFDNIVDKGEDLAWPATASKDLNGQGMLLDNDLDTGFVVIEDDVIEWFLGGTTLFKMDGSATNPVEFLRIRFGVSGANPSFQMDNSAGTDVGLNFVPKGTASVYKISTSFTIGGVETDDKVIPLLSFAR